MAENRKVLFVKLKLKGTTLQWWKRVEEQRTRQGKPKVITWEQMKLKQRKQFLPADYTMELYEKFHCLKQNKLLEEYTAEFNNLSLIPNLTQQKSLWQAIYQIQAKKKRLMVETRQITEFFIKKNCCSIMKQKDTMLIF